MSIFQKMLGIASLSLALLASTSGAIPSSAKRRAARIARRHDARSSGAHQNIDAPKSIQGINANYNPNVAGAVLSANTATYKAITGVFSMPIVAPLGGVASEDYSFTISVGLDGYTCSSAIFLVGVDISYVEGEISYDDYSHEFSGFYISAGDEIKMNVTATSTKSGVAVIENLTTGITASKSVTSLYALCEYNAAWSLQNYENLAIEFGNGPEPEDTITISDCEATTISGNTVGPLNAVIIDGSDGGIGSVSVTSSSVIINLS